MRPDPEVLQAENGARGPAHSPPPAAGGREALTRLRRFGGERLVQDMTQIFMADMPARIARVRAAAAVGDTAAVAYAAHAMKSSSAQLGAASLQRLCTEAERVARARDLAPLPELLAGIEQEFTQYRAWLEHEVPVPRTTHPPGRE